MNSLLLADILIFIGVMRLYNMFGLKAITSAALTSLTPFLLDVFIRWIAAYSNHLSLAGLVSKYSLTILIAQLVTAYGIFWWLDNHEESLTGWLVMGSFGGFMLFVIIPYFVTVALI